MAHSMNLTILGARGGSIDGKKFASIFIAEKSEGDEEGSSMTTLGVVPTKIPCDFKMLDQLDAKQLPGEYEVMVKVTPAAGGKTGLHATSCKYTGAPRKTIPAPGQAS